mmetsp:Transcript_140424/g.365096  ORF Transcript_140424/g.365096 Transcript_140424/m.365096 type:complete len:276 (-) Transcript_140424:413-1240(-)
MYNCMIMELLGKCLEDYVQQCKNKKFEPLTTAMLAEQLICRLEYLHSRGILHRDIKPENFMMGTGGKVHHVYMIDFGLSKKYWDTKHIGPRTKLSLTGTARYASINAHKGLEQSRRDDLEAVGHMLLYFLRSSLPWSGLDAKTKEEKYRKICEKKETTDLVELCRGFPDAFRIYLQLARELDFTQRPDYRQYRKLFRGVRDSCGNYEDHELQWLRSAEGVSKPPVDVSKLVELDWTTSPRQPDDTDPEVSKKPGLLARWGCFCGSSKGKAAPRDG